MYNEIKYGFVVSRGGFILVTNTLRPHALSGYIKIGPQATTSSYVHYFPISHSVANAVNLDRLYLGVVKLNSIIQQQKKILENKSKRNSNQKPTLDYIARCIVDRDKLAAKVLSLFSSGKCSSDDEVPREEENLAINLTGGVGLAFATYEKDESEGCKRISTSELLPMSEDSEWVISHSRSLVEDIEAAMRSTQTKEQLLWLLQKTGHIKEGTWVTPEQYIAENNIKVLMDKAMAAVLEQTK
jgi:hypothetical protein